MRHEPPARTPRGLIAHHLAKMSEARRTAEFLAKSGRHPFEHAAAVYRAHLAYRNARAARQFLAFRALP